MQYRKRTFADGAKSRGINHINDQALTEGRPTVGILHISVIYFERKKKKKREQYKNISVLNDYSPVFFYIGK